MDSQAVDTLRGSTDSHSIEILSASISAIVGAVVGSWSAFLWSIRQQRLGQREKEHSALLQTQYALISQSNTLECIRLSLLEPFRDVGDRHIKMPLFYVPGSHFPVPLVEISFITSYAPSLLHDVHLAQQSFETAMENLRGRNQRRENISKSPDIRILEFNSETGSTELIPNNEAGKIEIFFLKAATDSLYRSIDRAIPQLLTESNGVAAYIKQHFHGKKARLTPTRDFYQ